MLGITEGGVYAESNLNYPKEITLQSSQSEILMYLSQKSKEQRALYPRTRANIESTLKKPRLNTLELEGIFNINADEADILIQLRMVKKAGPEYCFDAKSVRQAYVAVSNYEDKPRESPKPETLTPHTNYHPTTGATAPKAIKRKAEAQNKKAQKTIPENGKKPQNGKSDTSAPQAPSKAINPPPQEKAALSPSPQRSNYGKRDALDIYLKEISPHDLISQQEEASLARRIRQGDEVAYHKIIESNLRFVITIAKEYQGRGLSLEDLIGEGNLGLVHAATRYDESIGVKFTTYAVWWIRQSIFAALAEQARMVRIPVNRIKHLCKLDKAARTLKQCLGREPSTEEIAEESNMTLRQTRDLLSVSQWHISLDAPVGEASEETLLNVLQDRSQPLPDEQLEQKQLWKNLDDAILTLEPREEETIKLYFGLGNDEPSTLEDIGKRFGLTRERVRQIRDKAIHKLRKQKKVISA